MFGSAFFSCQYRWLRNKVLLHLFVGKHPDDWADVFLTSNSDHLRLGVINPVLKEDAGCEIHVLIDEGLSKFLHLCAREVILLDEPI